MSRDADGGNRPGEHGAVCRFAGTAALLRNLPVRAAARPKPVAGSTPRKNTARQPRPLTSAPPTSGPAAAARPIALVPVSYTHL